MSKLTQALKIPIVQKAVAAAARRVVAWFRRRAEKE